MSEVKLQLKKAIPVIIVTWILSMITTLACMKIFYFAPNIFRTWHDVEMFEGYNTEGGRKYFEIPSMHWRICLGVIASDLEVPNAMFHLTMDDLTLYELTMENVFAGYMRDVFFTGSGSHFIEVYADNVMWSITVEAFY